jgi:hypothetical protein
VEHNLLELVRVMLGHRMLEAAAIAICVLASSRKNPWSEWFMPQWLVWLFALVAITMYIPVHLEGRYIVSALAVPAIVPLAGLAIRITELSSRRQIGLLTILLIGAVLDTAVFERDVIGRAARWDSYSKDVEWKAAG